MAEHPSSPPQAGQGTSAPATGGSPDWQAILSNRDYVEALHAEWKRDPNALPEAWQMFFAGFELSMCPRRCAAAEQAAAQSHVVRLIQAYRLLGHTVAQVDPLAERTRVNPDLLLEAFGLAEADLDRVFDTGDVAGAPRRATLRDILAVLRDTYCRSIGVEFLHIQDARMRDWLKRQMEPVRNRPLLPAAQRIETLDRLTDAEAFERFIHSRYPGQKRFSLEGAETLIACLHTLVEEAPEFGIEELVLGMTHRGRLNVLANILDKSYDDIFSEFEDNFLPNSWAGDGDVKYHKGYSSDHVNRFGHAVHVSLTSNPSHLEAVDPVVEGRTRAKQRQRNDTTLRRKVVPIVVHGDAAFAGQGIVAETFNLSKLPGYTTGGTLHVIVNNQIGFTTRPAEARSTTYATDVAKIVEAPIFHVNGDDPEAVVFVTDLALRFRQEFARDVVIDMLCYRRHGHNEGDEPAFTQPLLYRKIKDRPGVRELYTRQLMAQGVLTEASAREHAQALEQRLQDALERVRRAPLASTGRAFDGYWRGFDAPYSDEPVATGVPHARLLDVARALTTVPDGFALNPKVARRLAEQWGAVQEHGAVDWAFAEALAFGSLLAEGTPVRLSGQDSARGTFSQRHAVWQDMETDASYTPLNNIAPDQARLCVYNSLLSEAAVLGFDYGYSLVEPRMLILWEAQFGDFANGAQVIFDQFVAPALSKWQRASGLVMLLPHGYEGQGPEHSNAYVERYLAACAEDNLQVCIPSTPAQYFHVLRRQLARPFRRPLVLFTPKSLLRHKRVASPVDELTRGHFESVLAEPRPAAGTRRLLLCTGKVAYDLTERRERDDVRDVALWRLEQLHPFPAERLRALMAEHGVDPHTEVVWVQEEPKNRGAYAFVEPRLRALFGERPVAYVGRRASASPATGSLRQHQREQNELVTAALHGA